jgi:ABC-type multidrug transport system fused ATPase/permease subunit
LRKLLEDIRHILTIPEKRKLLALAFCIVFINIIDIASLALLVIIVNYYSIPSATLPSFFPAALTGKSSLNLIGTFLIFFIVKSVIGYFISRFQFKFIYSVASRLSGENLLKYLEGTFEDYIHVDSAVQIRHVSQQPVEFAHYVLTGFLQMFTELVLIILTVFAILIYNAGLFLLLLALLLPAVIIISFLARRRLRHVKAHVKESGEKAIQYLQEALAGYVESNIYDRKDFFAQRYAHYQRALNNYLGDLQVIQGLPARTVEVFAVLGLFILLAINIQGGNGLVSILTIGAFMAAAYKIIPGMVKIVNLNNQVKTYSFTADKIGYRGATKSVEVESAEKLSCIEFRDISFSYDGKPLLQNVNFMIRQGEMIGISSPSGKGKSTLLNILLGFLEPSRGELLMNNKTTSAQSRRQYWKQMAYVKQQPFLIHNSIITNITLQHERPNEDNLGKAIEFSGLEELIQKHELGLNTVITENGKNISGGQRQRIALARALYKDASVIILDEPFNELDKPSELKILQHLQAACANGKTVILITHNPTSLAFCTKIFSLNEG